MRSNSAAPRSWSPCWCSASAITNPHSRNAPSASSERPLVVPEAVGRKPSRDSSASTARGWPGCAGRRRAGRPYRGQQQGGVHARVVAGRAASVPGVQRSRRGVGEDGVRERDPVARLAPAGRWAAMDRRPARTGEPASGPSRASSSSQMPASGSRRGLRSRRRRPPRRASRRRPTRSTAGGGGEQQQRLTEHVELELPVDPVADLSQPPGYPGSVERRSSGIRPPVDACRRGSAGSVRAGAVRRRIAPRRREGGGDRRWRRPDRHSTDRVPMHTGSRSCGPPAPARADSSRPRHHPARPAGHGRGEVLRRPPPRRPGRRTSSPGPWLAPDAHVDDTSVVACPRQRAVALRRLGGHGVRRRRPSSTTGWAARCGGGSHFSPRPARGLAAVVAAGQHLLHLGLDALPDHARAVAVALERSADRGLDLVPGGMRRDRRYGRVGAEVDDEGPVGGERLLARPPRTSLGLLHPYAVQADGAGEVGVAGRRGWTARAGTAGRPTWRASPR